MQFISRSVRQALPRLAHTRALADSTASSSAPAVEEGVKSRLKQILAGAENPMTVAEVWENAEEQGVKSKRHMKQMLQQMKKAGGVKTILLQTGKKQKQFGYQLIENKTPKSEGNVL